MIMDQHLSEACRRNRHRREAFADDGDGGLRFHPAAPPRDDEVWTLATTIRARVLRVLRRRGLLDDEEAGSAPDRLTDDLPVLAGIAAASVMSQAALGRRAGWRVRRLGDELVAGAPRALGPRHARVDGFDLHADLFVSARARRRLERVCRYTLRPPIAEGRMRLIDAGHVVLHLRHPWSDGTTALVFDPVELLERLAALTPRPRVNLILYHGVLAPRSAWRARVVGYRGSDAARGAGDAASVAADEDAPIAVKDGRWADWMRRSFGFDVLRCSRCGGRLRLIATIEDRAVIRKILGHLGRPTDLPVARPPPAERVRDRFVHSC